MMVAVTLALTSCDFSSHSMKKPTSEEVQGIYGPAGDFRDELRKSGALQGRHPEIVIHKDGKFEIRDVLQKWFVPYSGVAKEGDRLISTEGTWTMHPHHATWGITFAYGERPSIEEVAWFVMIKHKGHLVLTAFPQGGRMVTFERQSDLSP
jgi:hypothetical protein